jgi:hypothetical protein
MTNLWRYNRQAMLEREAEFHLAADNCYVPDERAHLRTMALDAHAQAERLTVKIAALEKSP